MSYFVIPYPGGRTFTLQSTTITAYKQGRMSDCQCQILLGAGEPEKQMAMFLPCETHARTLDTDEFWALANDKPDDLDIHEMMAVLERAIEGS